MPTIDAEDIRQVLAGQDGKWMDPAGRTDDVLCALLLSDGLLRHADEPIKDQIVCWLAKTRHEDGFPPELAAWFDGKLKDCAEATGAWLLARRELHDIEDRV
uniref:hypothetical protein n=1 Tax=Castellaniella defragrans TaxID=75697 RepID=UPI0033417BA4